MSNHYSTLPHGSLDAAFPHYDTGGTGTRPGMTMRDYFIAHAPATPHPWFNPILEPRPKLPDERKELSAEQRKQFAGLNDWLEPHEVDHEVVKFSERLGTAQKAIDVWDEAFEKARYVQWPAAWAEEMLRAREATT